MSSTLDESSTTLTPTTLLPDPISDEPTTTLGIGEPGDDATSDLVAATIPLPASQPSSSSSSPTSESYANPLTSERQVSSEPDSIEPTTIDAIEPEEFPNPFENFPSKPLTHTRVNSAPPFLRVVSPPEPQEVMRTPSVLRPSHPRSFNSEGSRRARRVLSTFELESFPLALGDQRLSLHPLFRLDDDDTSWQPHSPSAYDNQGGRRLRHSSSPNMAAFRAPWQRHDSSLSETYFTTSTDDKDATEQQIEVSERIEDRILDSQPDPLTRQPTDLRPDEAQKPRTSAKRLSSWKFWSWGSSKKQKA